MYDRTTVQGASFNTRGQLYRGHVNATALFGSPGVSALGFESDDPVSSPGRVVRVKGLKVFLQERVKPKPK